MADKTVEFKCLDKVLHAPRPRGATAKAVYERLEHAELISDDKQECPDFVFHKDDMVIGLEHFLVDVLVNENGSNARRVLKHRQQFLGTTGKKTSYNTLKTINRSPIVSHQLQQGVLLFDEHRFLKEFHRVARKHGESVGGYRATIRQHKAKHYLMGAMIEMPCQTNGQFIMYDASGAPKERTLNCVPLTHNLLSIMRRTLKDFDFVVILAETLLNELPQDAKVYCFWNGNYDAAIQEQRIPICTSFKLKTEENYG